MSRGKVFIGWNKDNTLAKAVQEGLEKFDFEGVIGGKDGKNTIAHAVGQTIIDQMDKCCSAIMLFSENENRLSANMLYELGYLFGSLRPTSILTVYIGVSNDIIPSDLLGIWAARIENNNLSNEEKAEIIVNKFVEEQNVRSDNDKLLALSEYLKLKSSIKNHDKPIFYNYEMAELILIFSHSAYIYNDIDNAKEVIEKASIIGNSIEISLASKCALNYFKIYSKIKNNGSKKASLLQQDYIEIKNDFLEYIDLVDDFSIDIEDFKVFFSTMCYNYLDFANLMYFVGIEQKDVDNNFFQFIDNCYNKTLEYCEKLNTINPKSNKNIVSLIKSYLNRNRAIFYQNVNPELCNNCFEISITERKKIFNSCRYNNNIDKNFIAQMEMEYYLALSDNIHMVKDEDLKNKRLLEIEKFLRKKDQIMFDRMYNINLIRERIKNL